MLVKVVKDVQNPSGLSVKYVIYTNEIKHILTERASRLNPRIEKIAIHAFMAKSIFEGIDVESFGAFQTRDSNISGCLADCLDLSRGVEYLVSISPPSILKVGFLYHLSFLISLWMTLIGKYRVVCPLLAGTVNFT